MDLSTSYLGLSLRSPLVASAGPLSRSVDSMKALADAGVGAIVMHSLFDEQLRAEVAAEALLEDDALAGLYGDSLSYFPTFEAVSDSKATNYLRLVEQAASVLPVPLIASLNGSSLGGWVEFARRLQDAGAVAIECNAYFVDLDATGAEVEQRYLEIAAAVVDAVTVPVSIKLTPSFSSVGQLAAQLVGVGVKGLVLFNRFIAPDIDIETMSNVPTVTLSSSADAVLPRACIAALRNRLPNTSFAGTSGVEGWPDVVKYLLAGADVVMTTSSLVRGGAAHAAGLLSGLESWMAGKDFASVGDFRGRLALAADVRSDTYERAGYVNALEKAQAEYPV